MKVKVFPLSHPYPRGASGPTAIFWLFRAFFLCPLVSILNHIENKGVITDHLERKKWKNLHFSWYITIFVNQDILVGTPYRKTKDDLLTFWFTLDSLKDQFWQKETFILIVGKLALWTLLDRQYQGKWYRVIDEMHNKTASWGWSCC